MFFVFGFGHKTVKQCGTTGHTICRRCNNTVNMELLKVRSWFTLFFIPIIPYKTEYLVACPICRNAESLSKQEFESLTSSSVYGSSDLSNEMNGSQKYAGKTPTQIAYLKEMEEIENLKNKSAD